MNTRLQTAVALAAIGFSTFAATRSAKACDINVTGPSSTVHAAMLAYVQDNDLPGKALVVATSHGTVKGYINPLQQLEPITGLYRFTFTVQGNLADQGFVTWHADGTEIMNSGRAPITQSFCMGAWVQTGPRTYQLNHWALSWDATGTTFIGPTNILENITLDRNNNSYNGSFTLTQYKPDGTQPAAPPVQGVVSATRVSANSN